MNILVKYEEGHLDTNGRPVEVNLRVAQVKQGHPIYLGLTRGLLFRE